MLSWLRIKNLALVDELEIEFSGGFNVISGETGAGKSVIMGAVALILGARADKDLIRSGEKRCEINAVFRIENSCELCGILENAGIECLNNNELHLKRIINKSSTRNFINDSSATLKTLTELGNSLIDIHGANEHQSVLSPEIQLSLLDRFAKTNKEKIECSSAFKTVKMLSGELEKLNEDLPSEPEAEYLRMTVDEIEKISPEDNEDKILNEKHSVLANAREILSVSSNAIALLNENENSASEILSEIYRKLQSLAEFDEKNLEPVIKQIDTIIEQVREMGFDIENYASKIELDQGELAELEKRMADIQKLKRRYGPTIKDIHKQIEEAHLKLEKFDNAEKLRSTLKKKLKIKEDELKVKADKLSEKRKKTSAKLAEKVSSELKTLGFMSSEFKVFFEKKEDIAENGFDKIEFYFSPNPGEKCRALRNVASSGEMSRLMLALKTVLAENDSIPVLIFDEIDVNIGGETAAVVGAKLQQLGKTHQTISISHLAAVAAKAEKHFLVKKYLKESRTLTDICEVCGKSRRMEIARMLGGTNAAEKHAGELMK